VGLTPVATTFARICVAGESSSLFPVAASGWRDSFFGSGIASWQALQVRGNPWVIRRPLEVGARHVVLGGWPGFLMCCGSSRQPASCRGVRTTGAVRRVVAPQISRDGLRSGPTVPLAFVGRDRVWYAPWHADPEQRIWHDAPLLIAGARACERFLRLCLDQRFLLVGPPTSGYTTRALFGRVGSTNSALRHLPAYKRRRGRGGSKGANLFPAVPE